MLHKIYISKEEAKKYWPDKPIETPEWDKFKESVEKKIEDLKSKGK